MGDIKEYLTEEERQDLINTLVKDYEYYINDSDDEELQEIAESGCFTVGSMNYYKDLDKQERLFGGDTGIDADFNYIEGEHIWIDGYYINNGKREKGGGFTGYECILGAWDGNENDDNIFYYFESEEDLKSFMETGNENEFVITKIERY